MTDAGVEHLEGLDSLVSLWFNNIPVTDGTLKAGTKVKVVEEAGSYCRVETKDGVVGFVVRDGMKEVEKEKD